MVCLPHLLPLNGVGLAVAEYKEVPIAEDFLSTKLRGRLNVIDAGIAIGGERLSCGLKNITGIVLCRHCQVGECGAIQARDCERESS